jgi:ankyrin repeat protein
VFCQLESLRPCLPSSVRGILAELPETLDATYERILQEIPKPNRVHAHRLLQCLTAAVRPLAVEELAEVLAIDFDVAGGIPKLNRDFRWADQEQAVLSACSSLIAIVNDWGSRRVQFSHFSVKEFLSSDRLATSEMPALRFHHIHLESAHAIMAQACLGVLLQLDDSMDKKTIEGYPLATYAGKFFDNHAKAGDVLSQDNDGVDRLLDPDRPHFNPWLWLQCGDMDQKDVDLKVDSSSELNESSSDKSSSEHPFPTYPPRISPLYWTLRLEHQYLTRHLILKRPYDLDTSDIYGRTPLHLAIGMSDFEATRMLLDRTADIYARDNKGLTPLHCGVAEEAGDNQKLQDDEYRCVRLLLERGADAQAQNNRGATPLHLAASSTNRKCVQILAENVTNINLRNDRGQTALHRASRRGDTDIISIILKHGADVDAQDNNGSTPLHLVISDACVEYEEQAIGVLLEHGANIDLRNHEGQNALHEASRRGDTDIIRVLLKHGPDMDAQDNAGSTPLHLAISNAHPRDADQAVGVLLEHGANINLPDHEGQTALHEASRRGDTDIISIILKHGPDVNALDNNGSTPLRLAISDVISWDVEGVVGLLLEHGANINLPNCQGQTALHEASLRGIPDIVHLTLNHGADVDAQDNDGSTPLHLIITKVSMDSDPSNDSEASFRSERLREVIKLLLEHGASGHKENNRGETPFHVAEARGLEEITGLLSMHIQSERTA